MARLARVGIAIETTGDGILGKGSNHLRHKSTHRGIVAIKGLKGGGVEFKLPHCKICLLPPFANAPLELT